MSQRLDPNSEDSTHTRIPSANINISSKEQDGNGPETVARTNRLSYADIIINDQTQIDTTNTEDNGTNTDTNDDTGTNISTNENNAQLDEAEDCANHENSETSIPPNPTTPPVKRRSYSFKDSAFYGGSLDTVAEDD